jgi:MFS family permease
MMTPRSSVNRQTVDLVRGNRAYRHLWTAQAVSLAGDWFTLIALAVLVSRDTGGSGLAVSTLVLAQILPWVVVGPWSGVLADRFDRRLLLVASDLVRAGIVLALIPAASSGRTPWVIGLALLHFTVSSVFEPARSALVPRLVAPAQLVAASTLSSVTWSVMLAVGGIVGGSALALVGMTGAFTIDSTSFLVSAALIGSIPAAVAQPRRVEDPPPDGCRAGLGEGLRWARAHPATSATLMIKVMNGVAVVDTFMVLYGTRLYPFGSNGARSMGLVFASFGVGAFAGPALLNAFNDGTVRRMRRLVVGGALMMGAGLFILAAAPSLGVACLGVLFRGMGGSATWMLATIILQKSVPDRFLGRMFSLDYAGAHLAAMCFSLAWGLWIDRIGLRSAVWAAGLVSLLPAVLWALALPWMDRRERDPTG